MNQQQGSEKSMGGNMVPPTGSDKNMTPTSGERPVKHDVPDETTSATPEN